MQLLEIAWGVLYTYEMSKPLERIDVSKVVEAAEKVTLMLPEFWREFRQKQIRRVSEEISWIFTPGGTVIDLGGSSGFHTSICAMLGMRAICVDNYKVRGSGHKDDEYWYQNDLEAEEVARTIGVEFVHADLLNWEPDIADNSIDVVMSFDNIEHLHHSPKRTYNNLIPKMKKNGLFILGGPNAANLLKRMRVISGRNIFSKMDEWYDYDMFIGHVREPIVEDLKYIAKDLNLHVKGVVGRNWLAKRHVDKWYGRIIDSLLRNKPSFCSDIYIIAEK